LFAQIHWEHQPISQHLKYRTTPDHPSTTMAKKKKSANPSAAKQSREQLLNQQKNGTEKKEEVKVPVKSEMELMREKSESCWELLSFVAES
jgi:hypothetical protein